MVWFYPIVKQWEVRCSRSKLSETVGILEPTYTILRKQDVTGPCSFKKWKVRMSWIHPVQSSGNADIPGLPCVNNWKAKCSKSTLCKARSSKTPPCHKQWAVRDILGPLCVKQ